MGLGLAAMYTPTYLQLNATLWKIIGQGHGPVMLALTMWLIWQRLPAFRPWPHRQPPWPVACPWCWALLMYVVGRSQDVSFLDVGSQMFVISAIALLYKGWAAWRLMAFPIFFIIFIIPIPGSVVDQITAPLSRRCRTCRKHCCSRWVTPLGARASPSPSALPIAGG